MKEPFKKYTVKVRDNIYHVKAQDEESAMSPFWSNSLPSSPKKDDVSIEEGWVNGS